MVLLGLLLFLCYCSDIMNPRNPDSGFSVPQWSTAVQVSMATNGQGPHLFFILPSSTDRDRQWREARSVLAIRQITWPCHFILPPLTTSPTIILFHGSSLPGLHFSFHFFWQPNPQQNRRYQPPLVIIDYWVFDHGARDSSYPPSCAFGSTPFSTSRQHLRNFFALRPVFVVADGSNRDDFALDHSETVLTTFSPAVIAVYAKLGWRVLLVSFTMSVSSFWPRLFPCHHLHVTSSRTLFYIKFPFVLYSRAL